MADTVVTIRMRLNWASPDQLSILLSNRNKHATSNPRPLRIMLMKKILLVSAASLLICGNSLFAQTASGDPLPLEPDANGWYSLFDGKTLSGWLTFDSGSWTATEDGSIVGKGPRSHLFSPNTYKNLEFKAEVKLNHSGNSGMYFRTRLMKGFPRGYETQVENSSPDPQKTGSLYGFKKISEQLIQDDTWWTQHVIAIGNRIIVKVNDTIVVDFVDEKNTHTVGHLALQQHDPGSVVRYKNLMVKPLPSDSTAALEQAKRDVPEIK